MKAAQITDPIAFHGEGPVWSKSWGGLRWLDMLVGDILSLAETGEIKRQNVGSKIAACVRPRRTGGAVIGIERGFAIEEADGSVNVLGNVWTSGEVRMNEGGCDPHGRFYCGSMAYDQKKGAGKLYQLDANRTVETVLENVTVSNGIEWSPDNSRVYYNDTATFQISVFDYNFEKGLINQRVFVDLTDEKLRPDGLTVDTEGAVWVALSNGGAVHRYTSGGKLDGVIEIPVRKVTACAFGGAQLEQLFITTSRQGVAPGEDSLAGSLFRADVGIKGLPVREFDG